MSKYSEITLLTRELNTNTVKTNRNHANPTITPIALLQHVSNLITVHPHIQLLTELLKHLQNDNSSACAVTFGVEKRRL